MESPVRQIDHDTFGPEGWVSTIHIKTIEDDYEVWETIAFKGVDTVFEARWDDEIAARIGHDATVKSMRAMEYDAIKSYY
jgi:hypothetical protein